MPPETARTRERRPQPETTPTRRGTTHLDHPNRPASMRPRPDFRPSLQAGENGRTVSHEYAVGDAVVCPHHGVGTVVERSIREFAGRRREYLTIEVDRGALTLMIPSDQAAPGRLRPVVSGTDLRRGLDALDGAPQPLSENWRNRRKEALGKLASGDLVQVAELVRDLGHFGAAKPLGVYDRQFYTKARELLEAELMLALGMSESGVAEEIDLRLPGPVLPA